MVDTAPPTSTIQDNNMLQVPAIRKEWAETRF